MVDEGSDVTLSEVLVVSLLLLTNFWLNEGHRAKNCVPIPCSSIPAGRPRRIWYISKTCRPATITRLELTTPNPNMDLIHTDFIAVVRGDCNRLVGRVWSSMTSGHAHDEFRWSRNHLASFFNGGSRCIDICITSNHPRTFDRLIDPNRFSHFHGRQN